jgi:predicted transcriptional regulator
LHVTTAAYQIFNPCTTKQAMSHSSLLTAAVDALHESDFEVYYSEGMRKYFDVIGVREFKVFIKVLMNIDNLGSAEGAELHKFADAFSSQSFVIGERAGMESLKEDVVYQRFGNPCVSITTFRKILKGESVSRFTKRGQFLVSIDGDALRQLREQKGITQDELASVLECTGQTIYRMESQNRIQEELFERLLDYLGKNIEVGTIELKGPTGKAEMPVSDPLKKEIVREYVRLKLNSTMLQNPVDFVIEKKPILTPISRSEAELRAKQRVAKSLEEALGCSIVHITKEAKERRLPSISFRELRLISSKEEIFDKLD